ncbi:MAG TPA: PhzF family phenazine biosynthesis protein [Bryobacteraceae bacterium]|jgi:PhzF family phenazine biosynthesis protein
MELPLYQVDAFASALFRGNPAAICPLERWIPDQAMQAIAAENNLAETAYYVPQSGRYGLRWFTPAVEVDLCGHATLAAASVILDIRREIAGPLVVFDTKSGELAVERTRENGRDLYALDFPARPPVPCSADPRVEAALGAKPASILAGHGYCCVFDTEEQVRKLRPDMAGLASLDRPMLMATAPGTDCDFVSRFFAPAKGIPEDPVTGSAHTTLIPYWASRLGKKRMFARQISARGGELWCEDRGPRVRIAGRAVKYLEGRIEIPCN